MDDQTAVAFGGWLRAKRAERGLGLREYAIAAKLDAGNLSRYERGMLPPPQDRGTLDRMARALGLKPGTTPYVEFMDRAAVAAGRLPADLTDNPDLLARMPLLFRTARGKISRDELLALAERLKSV